MKGIANYYKESIRKCKAGNSNKMACIPIIMTKATRDVFVVPSNWEMRNKDRNSVITIRVDSKTIRRRPYKPTPFTNC